MSELPEGAGPGGSLPGLPVGGRGPAEAGRALPARRKLIRANRSLGWRDLTELWDYRELLYFLTWREIKLRYKQTLLGVGWAVLQPLLSTAILAVVFGRLSGLTPPNVPYPVFACAGLWLWFYFANGITLSGNSVVAGSQLVTKIYFPRILLPWAAVLSGLVDLVVSGAVLFALILIYGTPLNTGLFLLVVPLATTILFTGSLGTAIAALNVRYRDVRYALPFVVQLLMFVTPVIYPRTLLPPQWRALMYVNPMAGTIEAARALLWGESPDWGLLGAAVLLSGALFLASFMIFRRAERTFADVV